MRVSIDLFILHWPVYLKYIERVKSNQSPCTSKLPCVNHPLPKKRELIIKTKSLEYRRGEQQA